MLVQKLNKKKLILVGLESVGKTTLFSRFTHYNVGEETNVKGSTFQYLEKAIIESEDWTVVDSPGVRINDELGKQSIINEARLSDACVFIIRGTHFHEETKALQSIIENIQKPALIAVSFKDKMRSNDIENLLNEIEKFQLPIIIVDSREGISVGVLLKKLEEHKSITINQIIRMLDIPIQKNEPKENLFDNLFFGPIFSFLALLLFFAVPVFIAYQFSQMIQPLIDQYFINYIVNMFSTTNHFIRELFVGTYGILTLGTYSFIWAFPVILLIGCSLAIADETGIKDRISDTLDPYMRKIGLNGQDLIPILGGFGCNVVAVQQSRSCSICTRKQCVSFITFGSACSYQIGATLSIFSSAHKYWLFLPYLFTLVVVGAIHTRIWNRKRGRGSVDSSISLSTRRTFIQRPTLLGIKFRVKSTISQFIFQAMPIFILICVIAAILQYLNVLNYLATLLIPILKLFQIPVEVAIGLIFSIIRKDGILLFYQGEGQLLSSISTIQLFLLVYLASTFTACLVTMWTIKKEFGTKLAFQMIGKQIVTSSVSSIVIYLLILILPIY